MDSKALKFLVLNTAFNLDGFKLFSQHQYLAAKHPSTGAGIFVIDGNFGSEEFDACKKEARLASIQSQRMRVYCRSATFSNRNTLTILFSDIGLGQVSEIPLVTSSAES